jgi:hypothetical protein
MKTTLSSIHSDILDALGSQQELVKAWSDSVAVLEETSNEHKWWWVRCDIPKGLLSAKGVELLEAADVLAKDAEPEQKKLGRQKALCWKLDALKFVAALNAKSIDSVKIQILEQKNRDLEKQLNAVLSDTAQGAGTAQILQKLDAIFKTRGTSQPKKFVRIAPTNGKALGGVPTLFLSDWHHGEVVEPTELEYLNEYNLEIANERADRVVNTAMNLLFHHHSGRSYDGLVLALGGDMLSGNILDELRATNETTVLDCALILSDKLSASIVEMADNFPAIYVPAVGGNHGRLDKRPTVKKAMKDNLDWLVYQMTMRQVQSRLGDACNVTFDITESLDLSYRVYGTRYLLTHGDQIGEGTKSVSFWPNIIETARRKQQRAVQAGAESFDYMLCGHFHRYGTVSNVIVNGSLKGYDEYAYRNNYEIERAIQAMWLTHPECGIIGHEPIYADDRVMDNTASAPPISFGMAARRGRQ